MLIWMLPNVGARRMLGKCSTRILPLQGRRCCWLDNSDSSWLCCHETFQTVRRKGSKNSSNRNRMQIFFTLSLVSKICSSTTAFTQFPRGQVCWWVDDDWTKAAYEHSPNLLYAATFTISDDDLVCHWWRPTAVCHGLSLLCFPSVRGAFVCVHWVWSFFCLLQMGVCRRQTIWLGYDVLWTRCNHMHVQANVIPVIVSLQFWNKKVCWQNPVWYGFQRVFGMGRGTLHCTGSKEWIMDFEVPNTSKQPNMR
jgi:hypothetical protein